MISRIGGVLIHPRETLDELLAGEGVDSTGVRRGEYRGDMGMPSMVVGMAAAG